LKIHDGGYIPVLFAAAFTIVMWTWRRGTAILFQKTRRDDIPLEAFIAMIEKKGEHSPACVAGTAIFLTSDPTRAPAALMHNLKHNHVIHERNIILTIRTLGRPRIAEEDRFAVEELSERFSRVEIRFGFMETQNVSKTLASLRRGGLKFDIMSTSFYLGRRKLVAGQGMGMPHWQDRLYIALAEAAADPSDYFRLPANRVIELGSHVII
jgi:KUP system potassium uptake protein